MLAQRTVLDIRITLVTSEYTHSILDASRELTKTRETGLTVLPKFIIYASLLASLKQLDAVRSIRGRI